MLFLPTFIAIFASIQQSTAFIETGALLSFAAAQGAPFIGEALTRLQGRIFGTGRAARSTDIVIMNKSNYQFKMSEDGCKYGGWSPTLLPMYVIEPHSSIAFGSESTGFLTGATSCFVKYIAVEDSDVNFHLITSNPFWARTWSQGAGNGVKVRVIHGKGNNNMVEFIIDIFNNNDNNNINDILDDEE